MKAMSLAEAKAKLSQVVTDAEYKKERTVISKHNKPSAVVIGYAEYRKLESLEDMYESRLLEESLKKGKFLSLEHAAKRLKIELEARELRDVRCKTPETDIY
jgi:prevent-host-death family protein